MKYLITLLVISLNYCLHAQNSRLQVQGNVLADTLSTNVLQLNGNGSSLIRGNGDTLQIGSGLSVSNDSLITGSVSGMLARQLVINNAGNSFALTSSNQAYTLSLPYASSTASGMLRNGNQTLGGIKRFRDGVLLAKTSYLAFRDNTSGPNNLHWTIGSNASNELVIQNTKAGNARLTIGQTGTLSLFVPNAAKTAQFISNTTIENGISFTKINPDTNEAFYADGSTKRYSLKETQFTNSSNLLQDAWGIRTNTPTALWEINGTGYHRNKIFKVSSNFDVTLNVNAENNNYVGFTFLRNRTERAFLGMPGNKSSPSSHLNFSVDSLGIGTENPTAKLEVAGRVKSTGFKTAGGSANQAYAADGSTVSFGGTLSVSNGQISGPTTQIYDVVEKANDGSNFCLDFSNEYVVINGSPPSNNYYIAIFLPSANYVGKRFVIKNVSTGNASVAVPGYIAGTNSVTPSSTGVTDLILTSGATMILISTGNGYLLERAY